MKKQLLLLTMAAICFASHAQKNTWQINADKIDPSNYSGITVANGQIGIVSSSQPLKVQDVVLAGAYDQYGRGRVSNFLRSFNLLNMRLNIGGMDVDAKTVTNFKQSLDMKRAAFSGTFTLGNRADVSYTYYALRQLPFSVLMEVTVTPKQNTTMQAASVMEAPDALKDVQNYYNEIDRPHVTLSLLTSQAKSPTGKLTMCASNSFMFSEPHGSEPRIIHEMWDNNMHLMKFNKNLEAGIPYTFWVTGSSITSAQHDDPLNEAERLTIFAVLEGANRLKQFHTKAWEDLWQSDIIIDGDDETQLEVRSMLYHLYSFVREGNTNSPSPMGLSGLGYNGHVFWDTELWMFPALLVMKPGMARSMIDYRFDRLEAARRNAYAHGYKGAMFPWESAGTGVEETPVWALTGPFEHHITADIGVAAWNYFCVTKDTAWLKEKGWPLLKATAEFWASRVERNSPGHYDIKNVVAADEWAENVDNNAFTNGAAKVNLLNANKAATVLGLAQNADWNLVAANIPFSQNSEGVTKEHDAYNGETIKQADVALLAYPLKLIKDPKQIEKDLAFYEGRYDVNGPAMTRAVIALQYSRLGKGDKAFEQFKKSYTPNLRAPFGVIAECATCQNPYFATGAGGMLQAMIMGFGGLDISDDGIKQVSSSLPKHWKSVTIKGYGPDMKTVVVKQ
ncbi:MAG: glycoside hydrolase family 65 protein [Chitinophagaceae bacterium]